MQQNKTQNIVSGRGTRESHGGSADSNLSTRRETLYVVIAFGVLSIVLVGAMTHLDPLRNTPFGADPAFYLWSMKWWPHALASLRNPFDAPIFYPANGNLAWTASVPTLALLMSPLTALTGPVFALNVANMLSLIGNGVFVYLIARQLGCKPVWSGLGALLFYFSSYTWNQLLGHLNLSTVVFTLAFTYLTVCRLNANIGRVKYIVISATVLALQFGVSVEVYATSIFFLAILGVILFLSFGYKESWKKTIIVGSECFIAICLSLLLVSPYLYQMLSHFESNLQKISFYVADPVNYLIPTRTNLLLGPVFATISSKFTGNASEQDVYIGLPMVLLLVFAGRRFYSEPLNRALLIGFGIAVLCSFGPQLTILSDRTIRLPWWWVEKFPLIKEALPSRFGLYTSLLAAVLAAKILTELPKWDRKMLAIASLCFVLPNLNAYWPGVVPYSTFFTNSEYKKVIPEGAKVLVLPTYEHGGYTPAIWQLESNFWFVLTNAPLPAKGNNWRIYGWIYSQDGSSIAKRQYRFLNFLKHSKTEFVLTDSHLSGELIKVFNTLNFPYRQYDDVRVSKISSSELNDKLANLSGGSKTLMLK